jgi:glyceraldehyde 3-phosphate dehydrogenase
MSTQKHTHGHRPRIAINGFGRIGRCFARVAALDPACPFDLVAANDLAGVDSLAYLLQYDTSHGRLPLAVQHSTDTLTVGTQTIQIVSQTDPAQLPWQALGIDLVIESTGRFVKRSQAVAHVTAGARRVLISAPGDGKDAPDATVVHGINDAMLKPEHTVISAASCTTTCLAPVAKALDDAYGIKTGTMTTVHAFTSDQALLDVAHKKDFRRGRTATQNIVPTSTGAAKAIGLVVPKLGGKLHGVALRVPVQDVSLCDLVIESDTPVTRDAVNDMLRKAAQGYGPGVMRVEDQPVVSSDLMGDPTGAIVDSELTHVQGNLIKVVAWYDNEWGYANRLYQLACHIVTQLGDVPAKASQSSAGAVA